MNSIVILVIFFTTIAVFIWAVRSPKTRVELVGDWKSLHKKFSTRMTVIATAFVGAIPMMDQISTTLPQIDAIDALHDLTESKPYKLLSACLVAFIILARAVKVPPKQ